MLKEKRKPLRVLSKAQANELLNAIENPTHKLMARMGLQVGLHREEINTFPKKYVVYPKSGTKLSGMFRVRLNPRDMRTKGSKARVVDVPWRLMADLWDYVIIARNQLTKLSSQESNELFLNQFGQPYKPEGLGLNHALVALNLDFKVTAHVLRHTYATHTLYEMR
jgi:integrase